MDDDDKRWSLREEISKLFDASLRDSFPDLEEEALIRTSQTREAGDYNCQNVLTISPKFRKSPDLKMKYPGIAEPRDIGEAIKRNLPTYAIDMIDQEPLVQDVGFVTLSLSRKWLAKSIHMMLKDGMQTWAPKLPVEKVVIGFPTLNEENPVGIFRRAAIKFTLTNMLYYSGVDIRLPKCEVPKQPGLHHSGEHILKSSFLIEDRVTHVVINGKKTLPFILKKDDFGKSCVDLDALREVTELKTVDWVIFVAPVWQQEYIEMCFTAAKHEKWIVSDRMAKWNPSLENDYPVATFAGYRTCSTEQEELGTLLRQVNDHCKDIALHGYSAEQVFHCVLVYTCLKNHRLADCTFNFNEMVEEKGNTFVYLLRTRVRIYRVINDFMDEIHELTKASELILETYEEWVESEERELEFHLLKFTEDLKESCLSVSPHLMCEYLYDLTKKFNSYYDSMRKLGYVCETSVLLLCKATAVVVDACFLLLGIDKELIMTQSCDHRLLESLLSSVHASEVGEDVAEPDEKKQKMVEIEEMDETTLRELKFGNRSITSFVSGAREPARNSRFELFSYCSSVTSGGEFEEGNLFGLISVSDKYGCRPDGGDYLFEPDFPYVHLFDFEWYRAIYMRNGRMEHFGNPSSPRSVPFSSSIEIFVELYVTTEKKDACFQLSNKKFKLDLSDFWGQNSNTMCGCLIADGKDGTTSLYYIAIKDAVDATLEVKFNAGNQGEVYGHIFAYYGGTFSYNRPNSRNRYKALLFASKFENGTLSLMKSELAVPRYASLMIRARLEDPDTNRTVLGGTYEFVPGGSSQGQIVGIEGATCSLELNVVWKYQAQ